MIRNPFKIKIKFEDRIVNNIHANDSDDAEIKLKRFFKKFK